MTEAFELFDENGVTYRDFDDFGAGTEDLDDFGDRDVPSKPVALTLITGTDFDMPSFDEDPGWRDKALCAQTDPELFFPEKGGSTRESKRVCMGCSVKDECLEYALANDERFGVWGGLSERERRRLKQGII